MIYGRAVGMAESKTETPQRRNYATTLGGVMVDCAKGSGWVSVRKP